MKGNLTIDNGNTSVKVAYFIGTQVVATNRFMRRDVRLLDRFISSYKPDTAIVCGTASTAGTQRLEQLVEQRCRHVIHLTHETPMPIRLGYSTPQTLGRDRIATAVGAWNIAQRLDNASDVLVIDAGTAITYDLVTADGCFVGGNIAPGLKMRFTMLQRMTKKLPLVDAEENELIPLFGKNTRDAIAAGVVRGVAYEVKGYMRTLREKMPHFQTYLTGGHAPYILNNVRTSRTENRQMHFEKNLVLIGLNTILTYNKLKNEK